MNTSKMSKMNTITPFDSLGDTLSRADHDQMFSPSSLFIQALVKHICRVHEKDTIKQMKLYEDVCMALYNLNLIDKSFSIIEFDRFRKDYLVKFFILIKEMQAVNSSRECNDQLVPLDIPITSFNSLLLDWSRYATDFIEIKFIDKGGFGEVIKVQNKLDAEYYAIKRIRLKYASIKSMVRGISEVRMLASLNHPNIVSYKAAWFEPSWQKKIVKAREKEINPLERSIIISDTTESNEEESSNIIFYTSENSEKVDIPSTFSTNIISSSESTDNSIPENFVDKLSADCVDIIPFKKRIPRLTHELGQDWTILFIQMELCHETIRQWLDRRNSVCGQLGKEQCIESLKIFHKIVCGVEFIHSKRIVHHDIKPNNIFISKDGDKVQVGDFGLSCSLLHDLNSENSSIISIVVPTGHEAGQLGTERYAAPEQLQGKCDPKSDIFSLGIVLYELVAPLKTYMERDQMIKHLRKKKYESVFDGISPDIERIIKFLLNENFAARPTASELLEIISTLLAKMCDNNSIDEISIIAQLKHEIMDKDDEIRKLKEKLTNLQCNNLVE